MITHIKVDGYRVFRQVELEDIQSGLNVIVGDNQAGKSTLLEAVGLALTGRIGSRWARDDLNPYWFNQDLVTEFFAELADGKKTLPPSILIEIYLDSTNDDFQQLRGVYNSRHDKDAAGVKLEVVPDDEYKEDFETYLNDPDRPPIVPVEYYKVLWRSFANEALQRRPRQVGLAIIDSRTIRNPSGIDHHTREMLADFVEAKEKVSIAVAHRKARHEITSTSLADANARIRDAGTALHDRALGLQMDQSAGASWEGSVVPSVDDIPFGMAGQGQQAAIKVALAMNRQSDATTLVLLEEPENHLSYSSLRKLIARVETLAGHRQLLVTTHSSFVLNRLGLNQLLLLHQGHSTKFGHLSDETVRYFQRLSGFDTLRLVLAEKAVLVEGPSDEMVFTRAYMDKHGVMPLDHGIDVISMQGVALARSLELAHALDRRVAVLRDNDGKPADHWTAKVAGFLKNGAREMFIGDVARGRTLEPQMGSANDHLALEGVLGLSSEDYGDDDDVVGWMLKNKTEAALRILTSPTQVAYPDYVNSAIDFIE